MDKYRTSSELELRPDGTAESGWSVYAPQRGTSTYEIENREVVDLLLYCESGRTVDEMESHLREELGIPGDEAETLVSDLVSASVLVPGSISESKARWFRYWWTQALYYHLETRDAPSEATVADRRSPVELTSPPRDQSVALPVPDEPPASSVAEVVTRRRTCRSFDGEPVALEDLSKMLYYAASQVRKIRAETGDEIEPDAWEYGELASIPIGMYLVVFQPDDLDCGIYEYDIDRHALAPIETDLSREEFETLPSRIYADDDADRTGAAVLYSVDFEQYQRLFPYARALRGMYANVSRLAHRFLLVATALEYQVFQSGALAHGDVNDLLRLNTFDESVVFMTAVGKGTVEPGLGGEA